MAAATTSTVKWAEDLGGFANAVDQMRSTQLKSDALKDVKNLGLLSLGVGAAGAGAIGLYNVLKRNKERRVHGPAALPISLPSKTAGFSAEKQAWSWGDLLRGNEANTKGGIPWYPLAMLGIGGLGLG